MAMDKPTALAYVKPRCAALFYPQLSDAEINEVLDDCLRYTTWAANTPYVYGVYIIPTKPNGHVYRCRVGGTSGSAEPTWLAYLDFVSITANGYSYTTDYLRTQNSDVVFNDGTVTWQEYGPDHIETYDLRKAIRDCWLKKAAKVSADHDFATDLQSFKREQVYENCMDQAAKWAPQRIT